MICRYEPVYTKAFPEPDWKAMLEGGTGSADRAEEEAYLLRVAEGQSEGHLPLGESPTQGQKRLHEEVEQVDQVEQVTPHIFFIYIYIYIYIKK